MKNIYMVHVHECNISTYVSRIYKSINITYTFSEAFSFIHSFQMVYLDEYVVCI